MVTIREIAQEDKASWLGLWQGYLDFYKESLPDAMTQSLWDRLHNKDVAMHGFVAELDGEIIGFSNVVIHEATWTDKPVCYLEDLYVDSAVRGKGTGRALIQHLIDLAKTQGWSRVYWHTDADNKQAQLLYDSFTDKCDSVRYRLSID